MPNEYLDNINLNGTTYDIKDTVSGYMSDVQVNGASIVNDGRANLVTNTAYNASSNKLATMADVGAAGGGTVTSVGINNSTDGGLTVSGSPITSSGTISVGHSNVLASAQTTQGVYPITIDKNGHITAYGDAVNQLFEVVVSSDGNNITANKTYAQIIAAYTANKFVYVTFTYDDNQDYYKVTMPLTSCDSDVSGDMSFESLTDYGQYILTLNSSDVWSFSEYLFAASSHTHGNIQSDGSLQTNDATIETGDKLVITVNSDSGKIARSSLAFDTTNTTEYLRRDGTWDTPDDVSVIQTSVTASGYTYWRPLLIGRSSNTAQGFTPSTVTGNAYTFSTLEVQPSTGTIRIGALSLYNGSYTSTFKDTTLTANRTITVPNKSGTLALTSDIQTVNDGDLKLQKNSDTPTSIFTANQSGDSTLQFTTDSVGSASGWSAGSTPSLGSPIVADEITSWRTNTPTTLDLKDFDGGSFTQGMFAAGSFTQGSDTFTANTPTVVDTTKFNGGSFVRGTFNGGSFSQGTDSFTPANLGTGFYTVGTAADFEQGQDTFTPATHGNDSFTPNTPTAIDVSKFSGGSLTASLGSNSATVDNPTTLTLSFTGAAFTGGFYTPGTAASYTQGAFNGGAFVQGEDQFAPNTPTTIDTTKFNSGSFTQGVDSFTPATHGNDNFTPASLSSGFYTAGTAASFVQGEDVYTAPTHASDRFTPASIGDKFYSVGSAASLNYKTKSIPNLTNVGTAPSLTITPTTVVNNIESL